MSDDILSKLQNLDMTVRPLTSFRFSLSKPTKGFWIGLNPYMHPLPIPLWCSLVFNAGDYEVSFDGDDVRWRYCGPDFSTPASGFKEARNPDGTGTISPVGAVGPYEFTGRWMPGGKLLTPSPVRSAAQQDLYTQLDQLAQQGATSALLSKLIRIRGF